MGIRFILIETIFGFVTVGFIRGIMKADTIFMVAEILQAEVADMAIMLPDIEAQFPAITLEWERQTTEQR